MSEHKKDEQKPSVAKTVEGKEINIEEVQQKLEEAEKKSDEYLAGWQRARADFLNYKKEEMERIENFLKYSVEEFVIKLLPILDSFNLAEKQGEKGAEGLPQIKKQLEDFLKGFGIEEVKSVGEKVDLNVHEIVDAVPSEALAKDGGPIESGTIVEELQKGYTMDGHLLRPARVKVIK